MANDINMDLKTSLNRTKKIYSTSQIFCLPWSNHWSRGTYLVFVTQTPNWPRSFLNISHKTLIFSDSITYLYWTDWGSPSKIERVQLNSNLSSVNSRRTIISSGLGFPNGLAADCSRKRIYWTEAQLDKIEFSDLLVSSSVVNQDLLTNLWAKFGRMYWEKQNVQCWKECAILKRMCNVEQNLQCWTECGTFLICLVSQGNGRQQLSRIHVLHPFSILTYKNR